MVDRRGAIAAAFLIAGGMACSIPSVSAQSLTQTLGLGNVPSYISRYTNDAIRKQRAQQRQQAQADREAARREHTPHAASAAYSGQLVPVTDLKRFVSGRTLWLEHPIVADQRIQRMETNEVYFAANGKSYSPAWFGRPWMVSDNAVCISDTSPQNCWSVFQDDTHQVYVLATGNLLLHLARIERGDAANVTARYAENEKQSAANNAMATALLGAFLSGGMGGGGGGGSSNNTQYYYQNGSSGSESSGGSSYTAPVGGESGLYGSAHGVGD